LCGAITFGKQADDAADFHFGKMGVWNLSRDKLVNSNLRSKWPRHASALTGFTMVLQSVIHAFILIVDPSVNPIAVCARKTRQTLPSPGEATARNVFFSHGGATLQAGTDER
jgi:hypothetical protein